MGGETGTRPSAFLKRKNWRRSVRRSPLITYDGRHIRAGKARARDKVEWGKEKNRNKSEWYQKRISLSQHSMALARWQTFLSPGPHYRNQWWLTLAVGSAQRFHIRIASCLIALPFRKEPANCRSVFTTSGTKKKPFGHKRKLLKRRSQKSIPPVGRTGWEPT